MRKERPRVNYQCGGICSIMRTVPPKMRQLVFLVCHEVLPSWERNAQMEDGDFPGYRVALLPTKLIRAVKRAIFLLDLKLQFLLSTACKPAAQACVFLFVILPIPFWFLSILEKWGYTPFPTLNTSKEFFIIILSSLHFRNGTWVSSHSISDTIPTANHHSFPTQTHTYLFLKVFHQVSQL